MNFRERRRLCWLNEEDEVGRVMMRLFKIQRKCALRGREEKAKENQSESELSVNGLGERCRSFSK